MADNDIEVRRGQIMENLTSDSKELRYYSRSYRKL